MKKYLLCLLSIGYLCACQNDALSDLSQPDANGQTALSSPLSEDDVLPGRMRIKLREEPKGNVSVRTTSNGVSTGIQALDGTASVLKVTRMQRTFPYSEQYEERTRREGLHLWYDVWYEENTSALRAADEVELVEGIELACPVRKIRTRSVTPSWNDPALETQWNFYNPGTETWQSEGADIRLANVWQQYNGDPSIIVAVIDEGIDTEHPDLTDNLWVNQAEIPGNGLDDDGNGYVDDINGYNFYSDRPNMIPSEHGTHVAGIIAASNNNGTGVCGIAGGDGTTGSGVRLMCCQIIDYIYNNKGAEAIKYAADNGAVICQNSWGYTGTIDPVDKAAIDYFVKYAGCDNEGNQLPDSPMKGGLVLFATNNYNTSDPSDATPADYENVLGIAAINSLYQKASYSDYGDYIDLCAPGGERPRNMGGAEEAQILSTIDGGGYGYLYGASMACPHVSGVAALVIQKYGVGKQGFTAEQLKEILLSTAYDVDTYNPQYAGQLGNGCVNAEAALNVENTPGYDPNKTGATFTLKTNPVTDGFLVFRVNSSLSGKSELTIRNSIGAKVLNQQLNVKPYSNISIDIRSLAAGYYTLVYQCNGQQIQEKFVKY